MPDLVSKALMARFCDDLADALGYESAADLSQEVGFDLTDPTWSSEELRRAIDTIVAPFLIRKNPSLADRIRRSVVN